VHLEYEQKRLCFSSGMGQNIGENSIYNGLPMS
jgi:hypothetical protein